MPLTKEERIELLAKAREKKRQLAEERKLKPIELAKVEETKISMKAEEEAEVETKPKPKSKPTKTNMKAKEKRTLDISTLEDVKKAEEEFEIKNEVIRIKAPKKKTIVKRVIEVEEPSSDEEIQEEIINVPKKKSSIKRNETQKQSETNEPQKQSETKQQPKDTFKNSKLFYDIFPNN